MSEAIGAALFVFAFFFGVACVLAVDSVVRRRLRLRWYSGLISPCRGYVYRDGKWYPREADS